MIYMRINKKIKKEFKKMFCMSMNKLKKYIII